MGKLYRLGEVEEILAEMGQLAEVPDDIMESDYYQAWEPPFSYLRATLFSI